MKIIAIVIFLTNSALSSTLSTKGQLFGGVLDIEKQKRSCLEVLNILESYLKHNEDDFRISSLDEIKDKKVFNFTSKQIKKLVVDFGEIVKSPYQLNDCIYIFKSLEDLEQKTDPLVKEDLQKAEIETGKSLTDAKNVIVKVVETFEFFKNDFDLEEWKETISGHINQLEEMENDYKDKKDDLDRYDRALEDMKNSKKMKDEDKTLFSEIVNKYKARKLEEFNDIQSARENLSASLSTKYSDIKTKIEHLKTLIEDFIKFEQPYLLLTNTIFIHLEYLKFIKDDKPNIVENLPKTMKCRVDKYASVEGYKLSSIKYTYVFIKKGDKKNEKHVYDDIFSFGGNEIDLSDVDQKVSFDSMWKSKFVDINLVYSSCSVEVKSNNIGVFHDKSNSGEVIINFELKKNEKI